MSQLKSILTVSQVELLRAKRISPKKPPDTNRGVESETVSQSCDWLAFTVPFYKDLTWPIFISTEWKEIPPIAHFSNGLENIQGVKVYWHKTRPQMGKHCILSGSAIGNIRGNITEMLAWCVSSGYKVTRLDLCVDILHSNFNPKNSTYHLENGKAKTHARKAPKWSDSLSSGYTQYIGKKTSETYCRIYDKAAEMGVQFKWVRVEVIYQGDRANPAAKAYLQCGDCRSMVQAFVDFPRWRKWGFIMASPLAKVRAVPKQSNTRDWLLGQVAKSLAKEMTLETDDSFYLDFLQRVREEYLRLTSSELEVKF